jgi:5-methylcytosine-specific restriction endonuclease McrA
MKTCSACKIKKSFDAFNNDKKTKDGKQGRCRECFKAYNRKRYEQQGEKIRAQVMERYEKIGQEEWYGSRREWYQQYYQKNKERINKRNAEYAKNNREVRRGIKARYRSQLVKGMSKLDRAKATAHRKAIRDNPCFYCNGFSPTMHDDHYFPLARGGTDHWFNIVRSCSTCNQKKNARLASLLA